MFLSSTSKTQPNWPIDPPAAAPERKGLGSCIDGSDGYPTLENFTSHMDKYISGKKRADRTVITSSDLHQIHRLLLDPAALRADPNPSNRAWVKKTFFLEATPTGTVVCNREKGQPTGRPIAVKELMYFIIKAAHASEGHGGRDKTAKAVKNTHSYVRKGLICIFLETCPTCQTRIEAARKDRNLAHDKALRMSASRDSILSFGTGFLTPIPSPTNFGIRGNADRASSLFKSNLQSVDFSQPPHLAINRLIMPPELALVPAAPKPYIRRSRIASYPSESSTNSRKAQRMFPAGSNLGDRFIPIKHVHSPYSIMPNTAIASDFSSQYQSGQPQENAGLNLNLVAPIIEGLTSTHHHSASFPGEPYAWSHQPPTPFFHADSAAWQIEFADICTGNEPSLNISFPGPLLHPQPKFSSSEPLKMPFIDHFGSSDTSNLQFSSWSSVSPMTNVFPG
ncbi:hypothetical protein PTTG_27426 [Puccinia triticina 1-1 BBBD Race 1]|uniref:Integrase zinc-binding domain-containing protein n=2 Tax=Puccinia triticina TaxID=208348 RepID=A0A180GKL0_PUCT1|nr:uncharacterized protein PtA15_16A327 [Puccinia triticina]OAV93084.1 hypothetical protein PTTG_27426 [Puccinia triticina 1-1 BBBD Race 1]WAQ92419.1 hypothetical protein PtA15_16A327 [Puccinia triticina]WAR64160.1 hypothetical protein PtB15_16B320 [Puccinia triticina]